jgi:hypothetical protein
MYTTVHDELTSVSVHTSLQGAKAMSYYNEGFDAFGNRARNPYKSYTAAWKYWEYGYLDACNASTGDNYVG